MRMNNAGEFHFCILNVLMSGLIKKPEATGDVAEWSNSLGQNKIEKQMPSLSLPPPPPPPRIKKGQNTPFSHPWFEEGGLPGWGWIFNIVLSNIDVNLRVVCIAMWMTKHEQKPWQESGKNVCLKTAILVCNARNLLGVAFHRQFSRPHIEAGNRSTRTQSQGVRLFLQGKSTQRCLTMIKYTTLTTALWRLLLHTCHFLDYLLNNKSRRKNSI